MTLCANSKATLLPTHHERAAIAGSACSHSGAESGSRCFFLWFGSTMQSLSASACTLVETQTARYAPDLVVVADDGTSAGPNGSTPHDKPSRSVNSVLAPTNERRGRVSQLVSLLRMRGDDRGSLAWMTHWGLTSADCSSRRSLVSFARAYARGLVKSCWTG